MNSAANLLGQGIGGVLLIVLVFCFFIIVIGWPILVVMTMLSIRKIANQLERLANTVESKMTITRSGPLGL